jgi:hypothetical protein
MMGVLIGEVPGISAYLSRDFVRLQKAQPHKITRLIKSKIIGRGELVLLLFDLPISSSCVVCNWKKSGDT